MIFTTRHHHQHHHDLHSVFTIGLKLKFVISIQQDENPMAEAGFFLRAGFALPSDAR